MFNFRSITGKFVFISLLILCIISAFIYQSFRLTDHISDEATRINIAGQLRFRQFEIAWLIHAVFETEDPEIRESYLDEFEYEIDSFEKTVIGIKEGNNELGIRPLEYKEGVQKLSAFFSTWENEIKPLLRNILNTSKKEAKPLIEEFDSTVHSYVYEIDAFVGFLEEDYKREIREFNVFRFYLIVLFIFGAIFSLIYVRRSIVIPLRNLKNATEEIGEKGFDIEVDIKSRDEVGDLSKSFNHMAHTLSELFNEQKKSEEKYRVAEANLQTTFDISPGLICVANANTGYFTECNPAVTGMLGISVKEFTSKPFIELVHPDDRERTVKKIAKQLSGNLVANFENRYRCKDGSYKWLAWQATAADKDGKVHSVATDITKRKQAEEELDHHRKHLEEVVNERTRELKENEETLRSITSSARAAITMINNKGEATFWNEAAVSMFGWTESEAVGSKLHELIIPEKYRDNHIKGLVKFNSTGQGPIIGKTLEVEALRKDGTKFPVELSLSSVKLNDVWHAIGIITDITVRKKAEEESQRSERNFKAMFEHSHDGILIANVKTKQFHSCNDAMCKMLGYSKEEIIEVGVKDIHPEDELSLVIDAFEKQISGEQRFALNIPVKRKDGRIFFADITSGLIEMDGEAHLVASFRDVTDRKESQEKFSRYMDELERFNRLSIGREQQMIKFKEEINELLVRLGHEEKYKIVE